MRATIQEGELEIELVGSPTEIATVLREVLNGGGTRELPASSTDSTDANAVDAEEPTSTGERDSDGDSTTDEERIGALRFFRERSPTNNREATAVAAFYLAERAPSKDRSSTITKELLGDVFRQAQWKLPKRLDNMLVDTASAGYLNRVDTGVYELSNTGHNLVVHTLGASENQS
ncbi:hypothetical protein [Candidatus Poriferisocius sp.]|uniref:hypothetical protein n=1 Tax=Candidatus Poriferisocius sp. TaxID=3101276 RepID=UPI003B021257